MPTAVTEAPYRPVSAEPPRKRWTRAESEALEMTGLPDYQSLELVDGELVSEMGRTRRHTNVLIFVQRWLTQVFGWEFINPETPIDVAPEDNSINEPEPDIIVLKLPSREFQTENPKPADLHLVVEISDTTLGFDLTKKATLYARAGIVEYWVFNIAARRLVVHREPANGRYLSVAVYSEQETIAPLAAPTDEFQIAEAFR